MSYYMPRLSAPGKRLWAEKARYVLCHGPRRSGKSLAIGDKMIKHAIQNPGSETIILSRTLAKGEQGAWRNLTKPGGLVDNWRTDGLTDYVRKRKSDTGIGYMPGSKVPYFKLKSKGYSSTFQLHTLAEDEKVEDKFKDMTCTQFYLVEADSFDRDVFSTLRQCLRSTIVPYEFHQGFLDVNPPKEGKAHWLYDHFFVRRPPDCAEIRFPLSENCFISEAERDELYRTYEHDPIQLARLFHGEWVAASSGNCFSDVFNEPMHVIGDPMAATATYDQLDDLECLRPDLSAYELELGWDIGDQNSAVSLASRRPVGPLTCWDYIDEVVSLRRVMSLEEFVQRVIRMLNYWEGWIKRENEVANVMVRHWSDSSSMNPKMTINGTEAMLIREISEGRIELLPVTKGKGSVDDRRDMMRRALYENNVSFSSRCGRHIDMLKNLPPKLIETANDGTKIYSGVDPLSEHKHVFDSSTYLLSSCMPIALRQRLNRPPERSVSIRLA